MRIIFEINSEMQAQHVIPILKNAILEMCKLPCSNVVKVVKGNGEFEQEKVIYTRAALKPEDNHDLAYRTW